VLKVCFHIPNTRPESLACLPLVEEVSVAGHRLEPSRVSPTEAWNLPTCRSRYSKTRRDRFRCRPSAPSAEITRRFAIESQLDRFPIRKRSDKEPRRHKDQMRIANLVATRTCARLKSRRPRRCCACTPCVSLTEGRQVHAGACVRASPDIRPVSRESLPSAASTCQFSSARRVKLFRPWARRSVRKATFTIGATALHKYTQRRQQKHFRS